MRAPSSTLVAIAAAAGVVNAQQTAYGQCGGTGWAGATSCVSGYTCVFSNQWYSQCLPGSTPPTATTSGGSGGGGATTTPTATAPATKPTLVGTNVWIRAVAAPNFHKYLQSSHPGQAGVAVLNDASTAGQFTVTNGALVLVGGAGAGANLYAVVNSTVVGPGAGRLAVTFETKANAYGAFKYSGDALQWAVAGVTRPNDSAWLVCGGQELFVNLGSYGYQTPEGCADQTIHYYNGATADV